MKVDLFLLRDGEKLSNGMFATDITLASPNLTCKKLGLVQVV
jgi:hypothetical protein